MSRWKVFFYILLLIGAFAVRPLCAQPNTPITPVQLPDGKTLSWNDRQGQFEISGNPPIYFSTYADVIGQPVVLSSQEPSEFVFTTGDGLEIYNSNGVLVRTVSNHDLGAPASQSRVFALPAPGHFAVVTSQGLLVYNTNPQQPPVLAFLITGVNTMSTYSVPRSGIPSFIVIPTINNGFYIYNAGNGTFTGPFPSGQIPNFTQLPSGLCVITTTQNGQNGPTCIYNPNVHPPAFISIPNQNTPITGASALSNGQYAVMTGQAVQIFNANSNCVCTIPLQGVNQVVPLQLPGGFNYVVATSQGLSVYGPNGSHITGPITFGTNVTPIIVQMTTPTVTGTGAVTVNGNGNFVVVTGQTLSIYSPNGTQIAGAGPISLGANATSVVALPTPPSATGNFVVVVGQRLYVYISTIQPPVFRSMDIENCINGVIKKVIPISATQFVVVTTTGVYVVDFPDTCYPLDLDLKEGETPFTALKVGNSIVVVTSAGRILGFNPSNTLNSNGSLSPSGTLQLSSTRVSSQTQTPTPTPTLVIPGPAGGIIIDTDDGRRLQVPIGRNGNPGSPTQVQFAQSLSGLWRFEQGSGDTAVDSSGFGHDSALIGGAAFDSDLQRGSVMSFDGTGWIDVGAAVAELGNADFTIAAWVKTTQAGGVIMSKQDDDEDWERGEKKFYITSGNDGSGAPEGVPAIGGSGHGWIASNGPVITDGQWHHIAVTFQLDRVGNNPGVIYVDGVPVTGYAEPYGQNYNTFGIFGDNPGDTVYIGRTPDSIFVTNFEGLLDDVAIFARVLTEQEVVTIMGGNFSGFDGTELPAPFEIRNISGDPVISNQVVSGRDDRGDTQDEITGQFVLSEETDIASAITVITANESVMLTTEGGDEELLDPNTITFALMLAGEVPSSIEGGQLRYQGIVSTDSDTYVLELFVGELPAYAVLYRVQESALVFQEHITGGLLDIDPVVDGNEGVWISAPREALGGLSDEVEVLITTANIKIDADGRTQQYITDAWPDDGYTTLEVPSDD